MDTTQWPQGIGIAKPLESSKPILERKVRPQKDQALNCPRCNSTNTKFCYYNNYSLSQPRYFCKTCRRYWTEGGSLRNVPVGGGSRKSKRSAPSSKKIPDLVPQDFCQNPKMLDGQDLNLSYPPNDRQEYNSLSKFLQVPVDAANKSQQQNPSVPSSSSQYFSAMELLTTGVSASSGFSSFMPIPALDSNNLYSAGFPVQEHKPSLNFTPAGCEGGYGSLQELHDNGARVLFPVEGLKPVPNTTEYQQSRGQGGSNVFWSALGGGGSW